MRYDDEIKLDELRICYVASNEELSLLETVEVGEYADMLGYRLYRMVNDRFRCFFRCGSRWRTCGSVEIWTPHR